MKKFCLLLIGLVSFIGLSTVKADTGSSYTWEDAFTSTFNIDDLYSFYNSNVSIVNNLIDYFNNNLSSDYNYYFIEGINDTAYSGFCLYFTNDNIVKGWENTYYRLTLHYDGTYCYSHIPNTGYSLDYYSGNYYYNYDSHPNMGISILLTSNNFIYSSDEVYSEDISYEELIFPSYTSNNFNISSFSITDNNIIPTVMSLHDNTYISFDTSNLVEIDLNNYEYVILSLKNYNVSEDYTVNALEKGRICSTIVYSYGTEEKKDYISGYQTAPCSDYYSSYQEFLQYIKVEDVSHHAVYYYKAYDKSYENKIKIDLSVYDITYINSNNSSNPIIRINGTNYNALAYSSLTDTAEITTIEGVSDSWICAKYDSDCMFNSTGVSATDIFTNPIKGLKTVWSAIISFLTLIATFIALLPPTMQAFLYMAFSIAIILGIIKILL